MLVPPTDVSILDGPNSLLVNPIYDETATGTGSGVDLPEDPHPPCASNVRLSMFGPDLAGLLAGLDDVGPAKDDPELAGLLAGLDTGMGHWSDVAGDEEIVMQEAKGYLSVTADDE